MKKLFVFCSSLLLSLCISGQKATAKKTKAKTNAANTFCNTLTKVMAQAPGQFEKFKTGEYTPSIVDLSTGEWLGEGWIASINLPGALGSFIEPDLSRPNVYRAWFGTFQTETEAKKKLDILKKQLTNCLPDFTIENQAYMINSFQGFPEGFYFIEKKTNNTPPHVIELFIEMDTSIYNVYLNVQGAGVQPAKYGFCDMLKKILFSATGNFIQNCNFIKKEDIYNERGLYNLTGYKTDLILPGTLYCLIDFESAWSTSKVFNPTTDPAHYFSRIEGFNTETIARQRIEQIKNELVACLVNYQVEKSSPNYYFAGLLSEIPLNYVFTQKKQPNQSAPKFILQVEKHNSDFFTINLIVPGTGNQTIPKKAETAVQSKETTQPKLAKQLQQLLDYSKDEFKAIKGEEIKTYSGELGSSYFDQKYYSRFKTAFLPEGAEKSEVRYYPADKSSKFIASYRYYLYPDGVFKGLFDKMKKELGDGFAYEAHERDISRMDYDDKVQKTIFYRKGSKHPQIELILNLDEDTITNGMPPGILIVVETPNSQANITNVQVNKFNEQLSSIVADYANNFATIKGEMKTTGWQGNFYSKVGLQGADSVYLTQNWTTKRLTFIAVYPSYRSKEEARGKFNELVAQIDKCRFPCCTFAKADVSELSSMVVQGWLPFDLFSKMEAAYENILLEVEIHKGFEIDKKSEKIALIDVWSLVLRLKKL